MICHGQGDSDNNYAINPHTKEPDEFYGGCCFFSGDVEPCAHRLYLGDDGHIYDSNRVDQGLVIDYVSGIHNGKPRRDRVVDVIQGRTYICGALLNSVIADGIPTGANWEDDLDALWDAIFSVGGVAEDVGDKWAARGQPRNWCKTYSARCCFSEDQTTNSVKASNISAVSVQIASRSEMSN